MPKLYAKATLPASGAEIYNAIVTDTPALQNAGLPFAATSNCPDGVVNSREIGNLLYNDINLSNQFIPALLNGIAIKVVQSRYWEDRWVGTERASWITANLLKKFSLNLQNQGHSTRRRQKKKFSSAIFRM